MISLFKRKQSISAQLKNCLNSAEKVKYEILLFALIGLIFIAPYMVSLKYGEWILSFTMIFAIFSIVFTALEQKRFLIFTVLLSTSLLIVNFVRLTNPAPEAEITQSILSIAFYILAIVILSREFRFNKPITTNTIFAALSIYLLIAITFANAFNIILIVNPGSFEIANIIDPKLIRFELTYFSFTTLTTVGFGDIIPIATQAKSLVVIEQISGVLYLAALVSRLVSGAGKG